MSNRDTFVTSYLYNGASADEVRKVLPEIAVVVIEGKGKFYDVERTVWFAGQCKNLCLLDVTEWASKVIINAVVDIVFLLESGRVIKVCFSHGSGVVT